MPPVRQDFSQALHTDRETPEIAMGPVTRRL
jgi:hypothetical protein